MHIPPVLSVCSVQLAEQTVPIVFVQNSPGVVVSAQLCVRPSETMEDGQSCTSWSREGL